MARNFPVSSPTPTSCSRIVAPRSLPLLSILIALSLGVLRVGIITSTSSPARRQSLSPLPLDHRLRQRARCPLGTNDVLCCLRATPARDGTVGPRPSKTRHCFKTMLVLMSSILLDGFIIFLGFAFLFMHWRSQTSDWLFPKGRGDLSIFSLSSRLTNR